MWHGESDVVVVGGIDMAGTKFTWQENMNWTNALSDWDVI